MKTTSAFGAAVATAVLVITPVGAALADEPTSAPTPAVVEPVAVEPAPEPDSTLTPDVADPAPTPDVASPALEPTVTTEPAPEPTPDTAPEPTAPTVTLAPPLISTDGLTPIGSGVYQPSPAAPAIHYERYMPELHVAHIAGVAVPEGNTPPDEVTLDLRSLVGITVQSPTETWQESGFRYSTDGALAARPDTGESVNVPGFSERINWSDFAFDIAALPRTGIASDTTSADGKVRLVAFDQNGTYGVTVTLRHVPTGVTTAPITITGRSGVDGASPVAWVANAPEATYDGGIPMWSAADRVEWRNGHYLTWADPQETIAPTGERVITPATPRLVGGEAPAGTPAGFGLTDYGAGPQADQPSYRVGVLTGEPTQTVTVDLAERIPGAVAVALPSAEGGTLTLPATAGLWVRDQQFIGLDYNAPAGLTVSVSGTTVTFNFGTAEWLNAAGVTVPVLMADGSRATAEVRTESLPRDIEGGLVERSIPVETSLFISDDEMLSASRLTGLSPSRAEVQAVELPAGVTRVADGFNYVGADAPTELSFAFTVAETVQTDFGPVVPDATAPGEVRIAVIADAEPEPPVEPTPEPTPEPEAEAPAPKPGAPKANPGANTGGEFTPASSGQNAAAVGLFGGLMAVLGALLGFTVGRSKKASA